MANLNIKQCSVCHATIDETWKFDKLSNYICCICPCCGSVNFLSEDVNQTAVDNELNSIYPLLENAHFKTAREKLESLRNKYPQSSKAWFLSVLADNYVCFTKDNKEENRYIPTLNDLPDSDLSKSVYAKKALELAESDLVKESYQAIFDYIDKKRLEILEAAKNKENQCDIFISTKVTLLDDNGNEVKDGNGNPKESPDCANARMLYNYIQEKYPGKRIFFSQTDEAQTKMSGQRYENVIYAALHSAKAFILVAESRQSIDWRWVRNEWMRYLRIMEREEGKNRSFVLVTHSLQNVDLPGELKDFQFINYSTSADPGAKLRFFLNNALMAEENRAKLQAKTFNDEVGQIKLGEVEDNIVTRKLKTHVEEASSDLKIKLGRIAMDLNPQRAATREKAFKELEDILRDNPDIYEAQKLLILKGTEYYHLEDYIDKPEEIMKNPSLLEKYIEIAPEKDGKKAIESVVNYINDLLGNKLDDLFSDKYSDFFTNLPIALSQIILPYIESIDEKSLESLAGALHGLVRLGLIGCENKEDYDGIMKHYLNHYLILRNYLDKKDPNKYIETRLNILRDFGSEREENKYPEYEEFETKLVNEILKVNPSDYKTIWLDFCLKKFDNTYSNPIDLANAIDSGKTKLSIVGDQEAIETFNAVFKYSRGEERERFIFTFLTAIVWDEKSYEKEPGQETLLLTKDIDGNNQIDDYEKNGFDLFKSYIEYKLPENITYKSTLNDELKADSLLLNPNINAYLKKEKPNVLDRLLCAFAVKMHRRHFYEQAVVLYDLYLGQQETNKTFDCLLIRYYKELAIVRIADPNELRHVNRRINDSDIKDALYALSATYKPAMVLYDKISDIVEKQDRYFDVYQPIKELANQLPREKTIANVNLICDIRDKFIAAIDSAPEDVKKDLKEDFSYELDYFNNKLPELIAAKKKAQSKKKRRGIAAIIIIVLSLLVVAGLALTFLVFIPQVESKAKYDNGVNYIANSDFEKANSELDNFDYKDSTKLKNVAQAGMAFNEGSIEDGINHMCAAGGTTRVHYNANGGRVSKTNETITSNGAIDNTPTKDYYEFIEWEIESFDIDVSGDNYSCDLILVAKYTPIVYTITYELNGGTNSSSNPTTYTVESETINLIDATKDGCYFKGWSLNGNIIKKINKGSHDNIILSAIWLDEYTITYELNGGTNPTSNPNSYTVESPTITLANPTRNGYNFNGWKVGEENKNTIPTGSTGNITFTAYWSIINYNISYNLNGGSLSGTNPSTYNVESATISLIAPTKRGYTFTGWYYGNTRMDTIPTGTYGNLSLVAQWSANTYNFVLNYNYTGAANQNYPVSFNSSYTLPTPTRDGYEFVGWFDSMNDQWTSGTYTYDVDINLTAKWNKIHRITYILNGGTNNSNNIQSFTVDTNFTLYYPSKTGYGFVGWNDGTDTIKDYQINNTDKDLTLTAVWSANTYTVNLDLDGGTIEGSNTVQLAYDSAVSLPVPVRPLYTFLGWYYGDTKIGNVWKIDSDCTIQARWEYAALDAFLYEIDKNSNVTITGIKDSYLEIGIIVPSTIDGHTVTRIASEAFKNAPCAPNVQFVELPDTLVTIGKGAFGNFSSLEKLTTPFVGNSNITSTINVSDCGLLGYIFGNENANTTQTYYQSTVAQNEDFYIPPTLKEVVLTKALTISYGAFSNCYYIEKITPSPNLETIGSIPFKNCNSLTSFDMSGCTSLKSIGANAFNGININNLMVPSSVTSIGNSAFSGTNISISSLPEGLTSLGSSAFRNCSNIYSMTLPSTLTSIDSGAFMECTSLSSVTIKGATTTLGSRIFYGCSSLTSVSIGNVSLISEEMFRGCAFTSITIPFSCKKIEAKSLPSTLKDIYYNGTASQWGSVTKASGWSTYLSNFVVHCSDFDLPY